MNVLVTGGAGFIGSHLCEKLLKKHTVFCVDNFNDYYSPKFKEQNVSFLNESNNFNLIRGDIRDLKLLSNLFSKNSFEKVFHLAAMAGVRYSFEETDLYFDVNVNATENLLRLSVENNVKNFVFGSSSSVYGESKNVPFKEDDSCEKQISPYALSKRKGELLCQKFYDSSSMNIAMLRFFTVYGPRGRPDMAVYKFTDFISREKKIPLFGDGEFKRDYTFVDDVVKGILLASEKIKGIEAINLGNNSPASVNELVRLIEKHTGKKALIEKLPFQRGDVPITFADTSKAKKLLGWSSTVSLDEGISVFVDWFNKNRF